MKAPFCFLRESFFPLPTGGKPAGSLPICRQGQTVIGHDGHPPRSGHHPLGTDADAAIPHTSHDASGMSGTGCHENALGLPRIGLNLEVTLNAIIRIQTDEGPGIPSKAIRPLRTARERIAP